MPCRSRFNALLIVFQCRTDRVSILMTELWLTELWQFWFARVFFFLSDADFVPGWVGEMNDRWDTEEYLQEQFQLVLTYKVHVCDQNNTYRPCHRYSFIKLVSDDLLHLAWTLQNIKIRQSFDKQNQRKRLAAAPLLRFRLMYPKCQQTTHVCASNIHLNNIFRLSKSHDDAVTVLPPRRQKLNCVISDWNRRQIRKQAIQIFIRRDTDCLEVKWLSGFSRNTVPLLSAR